MFRMILMLRFFLVVLVALETSGRTAREWKTRVVYQIVTDRFAHTDAQDTPSRQCSNLNGYCGGTFKGIERHLDYIEGLGVNAIWISPFVTNTNETTSNLGYHGYWPLDIYAINPFFGSSQDLVDLVNACHDRDIWVMADVVLTHMGYQDGCTSSSCSPTNNFTKFVPFDQPEHYEDFTMWSSNLPKLNHANSFVKTTLIKWIESLSSTYGFDGFRIGDIDDIPITFLEELNNSTDVFTIGKAKSCSGAQLADLQPALDAVFDDDMYLALISFMSSTSYINGYYIIPDKLALKRGFFQDSSVLGNYIDNHDIQRFLGRSNNDMTDLRNALAYLLMTEGIPFIYYGTEQVPEFVGGSGSSNRESLWPYYIKGRSLYQFISTILKHRKTLFGTAVTDYENVEQMDCYYDSSIYIFTRKTTLVAIANLGTSSRYLIRKHPFGKGTVLRNIFDPTDTVTVQNDGTFYIQFQSGEPKLYSDGRKLASTLLSVLSIHAIGLLISQLFTFY